MAQEKSTPNWVCIFCTYLLMWLMSTCLHAANHDVFVRDLGREVDSISQGLKAHKRILPTQLYTIAINLDALLVKSNMCVNTSWRSLRSLNLLLVNIRPDSGTSNNTPNYQSLLDQISMYKQRILDCRVYINLLNLQKPIVRNMIFHLPRTELFDRVLPIWHMQLQVIKESIHPMNSQSFIQLSGLSSLSRLQQNGCMWYLVVWLICATLVYSIAGIRTKWLNTVTHRLKPWFGLIRYTAVIFLPLCGGYAMIGIMLRHLTDTPNILTLMIYLVRGTLSIGILTAFLTINSEKIYVKNVVYYYNICVAILLPILGLVAVNIARFRTETHSSHLLFADLYINSAIYFFIWIKLLTCILTPDNTWLSGPQARSCYRYFCGLVITVNSFIILKNILQIFGTNIQTTYLLVIWVSMAINALLLLILWIVFSTKVKHKWTKVLRNSLIIGYIALIFFALSGYQTVALTFIFNCLATSLIVLLMSDTFEFLHYFYNSLSDPKQKLSKRLRALTGVKSEKKLIELYVLMLALYLTMLIISLVILIYVWHLLYARFLLRDLFLYSNLNFNIAGLIIYPLLLLRSVIALSVWVFCSRIVVSFIVLKKMSFHLLHTQKKVISILNFIFFVCGLLVCLKINGVDLRSLLVITGGLSIGAGFGLKSFVEDLFGGWMLLLNKPFNAGDHILVKGIANGIVRNIGLLSTQLATKIKSDIFIPNSLFNTAAVVNLTYQANTLSFLKIKILLDDLSNAHLAKELLMSIAAQNKQVNHAAGEAPQVLFNYNGVDLAVVIVDIEQKSLVLSELIFEIKKVFKENQIKMTFINKGGMG